MECVDEALLPGMYKEVGEALHTDLTGLGSLTLFRSIVQSSCYPLAACSLSQSCPCHCSRRFPLGRCHLLCCHLLHLLPRNLGSVIGGLCAVLFAPTSILGVPGWRIAFRLIAVISVIVGILVGLFANDPHFSKSNSIARNGVQKPFWLDVKDLINEAKLVIVAQGVSGSFAGAAWPFIPIEAISIEALAMAGIDCIKCTINLEEMKHRDVEKTPQYLLADCSKLSKN
ncbi:hypothetical protein CFP56_028116 [Quercus suber]|uniref:Uncharacterized protein n=1 Tax=Quercus suber TaxID=58331 RepID=A0AAW0JUD8_QUESU